MLTRERLCTNHMRSAAIYEFYPDSAGKLTGMFLEATEVSLWVWQTMHTSKVSPTLKKHTRTCPDMAAFPSVLSLTWQSLEDLCLLLFSPRYLQLHLEGVRSMGGDDAAPRQPPKTNVKHKVKVIDDISEDEDEDEADIFAALEEACVDLGYTEDDIAEMLRPGGDYTDELLDKIRELTGCNDLKKIRAVLDRQKHALLVRVEKIIEQRKQEQTEEEMKIQEKLKKIGRSLSFVFTFVSRCASHLFCVLPRIAPSLCQHLTRFFAQMRMFCCSCLSHFPCSRCEHALLAALCHTTTFYCSFARALINAFVQQMPDGLRMAQSRGRLAMCGRLTLLHRRASRSQDAARRGRRRTKTRHAW